MRLTQLRDFLQVVDAGGIRAAARQLSVSQPALTKSIHQLEDELGVALLDRSSRGVVLSPAGRIFIVRARAMQAELARAQDELAAHASSRSGSVSVGLAPLAAVLLFPRALARFRGAYPHTRVRVVEGSPGVLLPMLREQSLDIVVTKRSVSANDVSIQTRQVVRAPLVIAGRRGHPRGGARDLAELTDFPWLVFSPLDEPGTVFDEVFKRARLPVPSVSIQTESYAAALGVLAYTDTLGIVSPALLSEHWVGLALRHIGVTQTVPSVTLSLYSRKGSPAPQAAAAMGRALVAVGREMAAGLRSAST